MARIYNVPDADNGQVFYGKLWSVALTNIGGFIIIDEQTESNAIDAAIDYAESMGWTGYFLDQDDIAERESDGFLEEYFCGGNHCLYLSDLEMPYVKRIPRIARRS